VTPIATLGEKLDPRLHHVVEVASLPGEPETIVRQVRPGYLWKGQVLRPAEVVTIASPSPSGANTASQEQSPHSE
jgi:molecular chaperone GrpE (heat shock protein)